MGELTLDNLKSFIVRNFELLVIIILVSSVAFTIFIVINKVAFLNFFYIPTLLASYVLGKKKGVLIGVIAVLLVVFYSTIDLSLFSGGNTELPIWNILLWGSFLIITAYVVGRLYELKEDALDELKKSYQGILEILSKFIDSIDKYTHEHSVRVSELAVKIAKAMNLSIPEVEDIRIAGLLHDVGKIDISIDVLKKASALNEEEWQEIKTHTTKGESILRPIGGLLKKVIIIIKNHHEYYDGSGYHQLKYEEIPIGSRILAVADAYDSMITDRSYRTGKTPWEAVMEIDKYSQIQFDPQVVEAFKKVTQNEVQYA